MGIDDEKRDRRRQLIMGLHIIIAALLLLAPKLLPQLHIEIPQGQYVWLHTLIELSGSVITLSISGLIWHTAHQRKNPAPEITLGAVFLAVGLLSIFHALSYPGMPPFITESSPAKAIYFRIATRLLAVLGLLAYGYLLTRRDSPEKAAGPPPKAAWFRPLAYALAGSASFVYLSAVVFCGHCFPVVYADGNRTRESLAAEGVIALIYVLAWFVFLRCPRLDARTSCDIRAGIAFAVLSEIAFIRYKSTFDTYNLLGHVYLFLSNYFYYRALFMVAVRRPYQEISRQTQILLQQTTHLKILAEVSKEFSEASQDVGAVLEVIARNVARRVGDICVIRLLEDNGKDGDTLKPVAVYYRSPEASAFLRRLIDMELIDTGDLARQAVQTGQTILLPHIPQDNLEAFAKVDPGLKPFLELIGITGVLITPLRVRGRIIGSLGVSRVRGRRPYTKADQALLEAMADRAAIAIDNRRLFQAAQMQAQEIEALLEAAKEIAASNDLPLVLGQVLDNIIRFCEADAAGIALLENGQETIRFQVVRGPWAKVLENVSFRPAEGLLGMVAETGTAVNIPDITQSPWYHPALASAGIRAVLAVPLRRGDKTVGVLAAMSLTPASFPPARERQVLGLADQAVIAVERAREASERARLEDQFRQAQKMEAIGRLAGGVAHDFNNLLTVISGFSELMLLQMNADHPLRKHTEEIVKAAKNAAALTKQLLTFSRRQVVMPKALNLNTVVEDLEDMLRRVIGEDIEVVCKLDPCLGLVHADPGQIGQVIMNLAVNARDAMPQGGRLFLETANVERAQEGGEHDGLPPGRYVMLAVTDTGIGMDEEIKARIFEPFFTTKGARGTGLGLSTVYGIVRQAGGQIAVRSKPGQGTTFEIFLPRLPDDGCE